MLYEEILNQDGLYIPLLGDQKLYPIGYCVLVKNKQAFLTTFAVSHNEPHSIPVPKYNTLRDYNFLKANREDLYTVSTKEEVIDAMKIGYTLTKENDRYFLDNYLLYKRKIPVSKVIAQKAIEVLTHHFFLLVHKNEYSSSIQIHAVMPEVIRRTIKPYKFIV
jgi:hypothetical protein